MGFIINHNRELGIEINEVFVYFVSFSAKGRMKLTILHKEINGASKFFEKMVSSKNL